MVHIIDTERENERPPLRYIDGGILTKSIRTSKN